MRKEKSLIALLRAIVELLADEAERNPDFAERVESLLLSLPEDKKKRQPAASSKSLQLQAPLLDIHAEWGSRGEAELRLWLRDQPIVALRDAIRREDLDPTRRTAKWKDPEKLAHYIADGLSSRLSRGSAFIGRGLLLDMNDEEFEFLRQLNDTPQGERTVSEEDGSRARLERLVKADYVKAIAVSTDTVMYSLTPFGRAAIAVKLKKT